jgi:hypothetical protein
VGKGDRKSVRWKKNRQRSKKERDKRKAVARGAMRK